MGTANLKDVRDFLSEVVTVVENELREVGNVSDLPFAMYFIYCAMDEDGVAKAYNDLNSPDCSIQEETIRDILKSIERSRVSLKKDLSTILDQVKEKPLTPYLFALTASMMENDLIERTMGKGGNIYKSLGRKYAGDKWVEYMLGMSIDYLKFEYIDKFSMNPPLEPIANAEENGVRDTFNMMLRTISNLDLAENIHTEIKIMDGLYYSLKF